MFLVYRQKVDAFGYEMVGYSKTLYEFQEFCESKGFVQLPSSWGSDFAYGVPLIDGGYTNIHYLIPITKFRG